MPAELEQRSKASWKESLKELAARPGFWAIVFGLLVKDQVISAVCIIAGVVAVIHDTNKHDTNKMERK